MNKESKEIIVIDGWLDDEALAELAASTGSIVVSWTKDNDD